MFMQVDKDDERLPSQSPRSLSGVSESGILYMDKSSLFRVEISDILSVSPCADLTLPPGGGVCIDTVKGPCYLVSLIWTLFLVQVLRFISSHAYIPAIIILKLIDIR